MVPGSRLADDLVLARRHPFDASSSESSSSAKTTTRASLSRGGDGAPYRRASLSGFFSNFFFIDDRFFFAQKSHQKGQRGPLSPPTKKKKKKKFSLFSSQKGKLFLRLRLRLRLLLRTLLDFDEEHHTPPTNPERRGGFILFLSLFRLLDDASVFLSLSLALMRFLCVLDASSAHFL